MTLQSCLVLSLEKVVEPCLKTIVIPRLKNPVCPYIYSLLEGEQWDHTFPNCISALRNANSLIHDLNLGCHVNFLHWYAMN